MDPAAARRARRKTIKARLADAYTDEEACPPEWVDLHTDIRDASDELRSSIARERQHFVDEPDIRRALARRERFRATVIKRVAEINQRINRLNLLVPHPRFTRRALDADELTKPLYRSPRRTA